MTPQKREEFEVYARLAVFKRRVAKARAVISEWLSQASRPYVAFSTGKDSTCVLALVREQRPGTPAVYFDADSCYPESAAILSATPNLIRWPASEPILETIKRVGFGSEKLETETMRTTVYEPAREIIAQFGFDGMAYGLRKEESRGRRMHRQSRGLIFKYRSRYENLIACQPVADWGYHDVWAFIVSEGLKYCAAYDRMWNLPEREQRISYWAGETNRSYGRYAFLRHNYPALWNQLVLVAPEVSSYG